MCGPRRGGESRFMRPSARRGDRLRGPPARFRMKMVGNDFLRHPARRLHIRNDLSDR
ncbi:protein of unknown function [Rhodovastum atsumiense]|nr:protein of unknown function [Rhodovastum atsumiense]